MMYTRGLRVDSSAKMFKFWQDHTTVGSTVGTDLKSTGSAWRFWKLRTHALALWGDVEPGAMGGSTRLDCRPIRAASPSIAFVRSVVTHAIRI